MSCCRNIVLVLLLTFEIAYTLYLNAFLSCLVWLMTDFQLNSTFPCFSGFHLDLKHHLSKIFLVQCFLAKQLRISSRVPMGSMQDPVKLSLTNNLVSVTCVANAHIFMAAWFSVKRTSNQSYN